MPIFISAKSTCQNDPDKYPLRIYASAGAFKMKALRLLAILSFISSISFSQTTTINGGRAITGIFDASAATRTSVFRVVNTLPGTCNQEEWISVRSGGSRVLYYCSSPNAWINFSGTLAPGSDPTLLGNGDVNATKLSTLNSITSNVQTQLNNKLADSGSNGIIKRTALGVTAVAVVGDLPTGYPYANLAGAPTLFNQTVKVNNATLTANRSILNFATGSNITITPTDNGSTTSTLTLSVPSFPYSSLSGAPSLFNQTLLVNSTAQTQRSKINITAGANVTLTSADNGLDTTTITISSASGGGTNNPGGATNAIQYNSGASTFSGLLNTSTTKMYLGQVNSGVPTFSQIATTDLTGLITTSQMSPFSRPAYIPAAGCIGITAASAFDLQSSGTTPTPNCYGTSYKFGALDFPDSANSTAVAHFTPPPGMNSMDLDLYWFVNAGSSAVKWTVQTACVASGSDVLNPTFSAVQTINSTSSATPNTLTIASQPSVTITGCSGSTEMMLMVGRDTTDTTTNTISLRGIRITPHVTPQS